MRWGKEKRKEKRGFGSSQHPEFCFNFWSFGRVFQAPKQKEGNEPQKRVHAKEKLLWRFLFGMKSPPQSQK